MTHKVEFISDYRCFKIGDSFEFSPGVNLLVGDQGTGKSSLLRLMSGYNTTVLRWDCDKCQSRCFDFEKDNLRKRGALSGNVDVFNAQVHSMWSSHGETNLRVLGGLKMFEPGTVCFLDEPDQALSIRSCVQLANDLRSAAEAGLQVIASMHSPIVIAKFDSVLSLEHRQWMLSKDFIKTQLEENLND